MSILTFQQLGTNMYSIIFSLLKCFKCALHDYNNNIITLKLDYYVKEATNWVCKHEWFKHFQF